MTDEELNEIASRLRRTAADSLGGESLQKALARITVAEDVSWRGVMRRLADLIEPEPERTCRMDKSEFADFAPEYEGLYSCPKCGEETAVLACVNEDGDMEWMKPRFCGFCGAKVVEAVLD